LQLGELSADLVKVRLGDVACRVAVLIGVVHERQQIANLLDREAEIAAAPDEAKALQVGIAVAAVPSRAPTSLGRSPISS
jgi:hypothetical protein